MANSREIQIPVDIEKNILIRLPPKSICRFKCVSKPWRALFSDPGFVRKHFSQHKSHQKILSLDCSGSLCSLDVNRIFEDTFKTRIPYFTDIYIPSRENCGTWIDMLGACNGLFLFSQEKKFTFLLINPSTQAYEMIPPPSYSLDCFCTFVIYGMGYDSYSDNYKVVRISDGHDLDGLFSPVGVYSLKSNSWRVVDESPYDHSVSNDKSGVFMNGTIHWLAFFTKEERFVIAGFDIIHENFGEVPLPRSLVNKRQIDYKLVILRDCLSMFTKPMSAEIDIWVMEEYGVMDSWTHLFKVLNHNLNIISPVCFLEEKEVLFLGSCNFVSYNYEEGKKKNGEMFVDDCTNFFKAAVVHAESLHTPICGNGTHRIR